MRLALLLLCGACSPTVFVDGSPFGSLEAAAKRAVAGQVITFTPDAIVEANVELAGGVTLTGPATLYGNDGPLLTSEGDLLLNDLLLLGGTAEEGTAVQARGLTADRLVIREGTGPYAIVTQGDVSITNSDLAHTGTVLETRSPTGFPRSAHITDTEWFGGLTIAGDDVTLTGITGRADVVANGLDLTVTDSELVSLTAGGRTVRVIGLSLDGAGLLTGQDATLLEIDGGTWQLDSDTVIGTDISVDAIAGTPRTVDLFAVTTPYVTFPASEAIAMRQVSGDSLTLYGQLVNTEDLTAHQLNVSGPGQHVGITLAGPSPRLVADRCAFGALVVYSEQNAAELTLDGVAIDGMIVVEPPTAFGETLIDTNSYVQMQNVSWIGGTRAKFAPEFHPLFITNSLFEGANLGAIPTDAVFVDTTLWYSAEPAAPVAGLDIDVPGFLAPGNPVLAPDSNYLGRGGFQGDYTPVTYARWAALRL